MSYCRHGKIHGHDILTCRKKRPATEHEGLKGTDRQDTDIKKQPENRNKNTQEWIEVKPKRKAIKGNYNPRYGPDLLFANTRPHEKSLKQTRIGKEKDTENDEIKQVSSSKEGNSSKADIDTGVTEPNVDSNNIEKAGSGKNTPKERLANENSLQTDT